MAVFVSSIERTKVCTHPAIVDGIASEPESVRALMSYMQKLRYTKAADGDDIGDHLNKLMQYWVRINSVGYDDINIPELHFKVIVSNSLPPS